MLNLLTVRNTQRIEYTHQLFGTKQTHQIVFQRNIKLGFARISLTSGTPAQLIVDSPGFMAFRTDDFKSAGCFCLVVEFDIRTAPRHIRRNRNGAMLPGLRYDFRLKLMKFRI